MARQVVEQPHRQQRGLDRLLAPVHRPQRLADHLDVAHRVLEPVHAEIEIVQRERLLEHGRVGFQRDREHRLAVVEHVVAPDLIRAIGEAVGMLVVGRHQQQLGRVRRAA